MLAIKKREDIDPFRLQRERTFRVLEILDSSNNDKSIRDNGI